MTKKADDTKKATQANAETKTTATAPTKKAVPAKKTPRTEPVKVPTTKKKADKVLTPEQIAGAKYENLNTNFFKGTLAGQINSVYKTKAEKPAKMADFKTAMDAGDIDWTYLTVRETEKMTEMGIVVPEKWQPVVEEEKPVVTETAKK